MSEEIKIDKRTKEYRDTVAKQKESAEVSPETQQMREEVDIMSTMEDKDSTLSPTDMLEVAELKAELAEMKKMLQTVGTLTANNTESLKAKTTVNPEVPKRGKGIAYRKTTYPRYEEWKVLKKFTNNIQGMMSHDKQFCAAICGSMMLRDVEYALKVISKNDKAREEALSLGICDENFKTVITK